MKASLSRIHAPTCIVPHCGQPCHSRNKHHNGRWSYHNTCNKHHRTDDLQILLRKMNDGKCARCEQSYAQFHADHIDGNKYNHNLNNIQPLCPSCHYDKTKEQRDHLNRYSSFANTTFHTFFKIITPVTDPQPDVVSRKHG